MNIGEPSAHQSAKYWPMPWAPKAAATDGTPWDGDSYRQTEPAAAATETVSLHAVVLGDSPTNSYVENNPPLTSLRHDGLSLDLPAGRFAPRFS